LEENRLFPTYHRAPVSFFFQLLRVLLARLREGLRENRILSLPASDDGARYLRSLCGAEDDSELGIRLEEGSHLCS
jgi:hypothetical protein